jgi:hypothetical protein
MSSSGQNSFTFKLSFDFIIETDDKYTSREAIMFGTPGIPIVGKQYGPLGAKCTSVTCNRSEESAFIWFCTAELETGDGNQQQDPENSNDPTDWIPTFKIDGFGTKEEVLIEDFTPSSVTTAPRLFAGPYVLANSAGQIFDPPYTRTKLLPQFSAVQFETASTTLLDIAKRHDTVNDGSLDLGEGMGVFPARTLLCTVKSAELGFYYGIKCWKVEYQLTYDLDTFDVKNADFGTVYLDGSPPFSRPYMDATNSFVINGPLDGSGDRVLDGDGNPDAQNVAILKFRVKKEKNFGNFIRVN